MKISELSYHDNSEEIFSLISDEPWCIFLDSGYPRIDTGRYDVITGRPSLHSKPIIKKHILHQMVIK